jgi:hypothetical protein
MMRTSRIGIPAIVRRLFICIVITNREPSLFKIIIVQESNSVSLSAVIVAARATAYVARLWLRKHRSLNQNSLMSEG